MPSTIRFAAVNDSNQRVLERFWQLYKHDLSQFRNSFPDGDGVFKTNRGLDSILDDNRAAFLIRLDDDLAGFAIVGGLAGDTRDVSESFILRSWRRRGVGFEATVQLIAMYPGKWRIGFQEENPGRPAVAQRRSCPRGFAVPRATPASAWQAGGAAGCPDLAADRSERRNLGGSCDCHRSDAVLRFAPGMDAALSDRDRCR